MFNQVLGRIRAASGSPPPKEKKPGNEQRKASASEADGAATKIQAQVRRRRDSLTAQFTQASNTLSHIESLNESDQLNSNVRVARTVALLDNEIQNAMDGEDISPRVRPRRDSISTAGGNTVTVAPRRSSLGSLGFSFTPTPRIPGGRLSFCLPTADALAAALPTGRGSGAASAAAGDGSANAAKSRVRRTDVPKVKFTGSWSSRRVDKSCVDAILKHVKQPSAKPLDFEDVKELIMATIDLLRDEVDTALVRLFSPAAPGKLMLLGDTHGQLNDVLWIFFKYGEPSPNNVYLFNGDIPDRGSGACEILLLVMLFKLWMPSCVHVNRGNHEDRSMNGAYGFHEECLQKWGEQDGTELFELFNAMFDYLPLFTVIDSSVFVVHGGLWRRPPYSLPLLERLDFRRGIPEPTTGIGPDLLIFDSVWSDPHTTNGICTNPRGTNIVTWGPDVTQRFLKGNGLRLLVRSHQLPPGGRGYGYTHGGGCLTVFSASNYCNQCGNLGGVLILARGEEDRLEEHWAPSLDEMRMLEADADRAIERIRGQAKTLALQRMNLKHACQQMEKEVLKRVQELVVRHKAGLFEHWSLMDTSPRGMFCVSPAVWREGCATVVDDALPWKHLQSAMGVVNESGEVHYVKFLTRYRIAFDSSDGMSLAGWERTVWSKIMETLLHSDLSLREALAALDPTNNGLVSPGEFGKLLESCGVEISPLQARALLRTFVNPCPGSPKTTGAGLSSAAKPAVAKGIWEVSLWDVLTRLQVSLPLSPKPDIQDPGLADWAVPKLRKVADVVLRDSWQRLAEMGAKREEWPTARLIAVWFEDANASQSGFLDIGELVFALSKLATSLEGNGVPCDQMSLARLAKYMDIDGNGRINFFEFLNGLTIEDALGEDFQQDLLETMHAAIYFNVVPIRSALIRFDTELSGEVSSQDFVIALMAVQSALSAGVSGCNGLTRLQVSAIADSISKNGDNISYEKFLGSFRIVDTMDAGVSV